MTYKENTQFVTITLEEYKTLLLKQQPKDNLKVLDWLLQECKEPILDDIEKEYLSAVIKPFRKRIKSIQKAYHSGNSAYIIITMNKCEHIFLPYFNLNSGMYKRMEINKEYTLKDLEL